MCRTHYNQLHKRLSTRDKHISAIIHDGAESTSQAVSDITGALWVGTHFRQCICCGTDDHKSDASFWRLAGQNGLRTHQILQQWLQNKVIGAPLFRVELQVTDTGVTSELVATDVPLGRLEWLCIDCWQEGLGQASSSDT